MENKLFEIEVSDCRVTSCQQIHATTEKEAYEKFMQSELFDMLRLHRRMTKYFIKITRNDEKEKLSVIREKLRNNLTI